jgi:hypothetical protein
MERLSGTFFHFSSGAWVPIAGISPCVRALCPILLLSSLATSVWAQPATLADLQGAVINVVGDYEVLGRSNGQDFSGRSRDERTIVIGPGNTELTPIPPRGSARAGRA